MTRNQRRLHSAGSLLVLALVFVALVLVSGSLLRGARLDLTQNRLYTLSAGTSNILARLDEPVNLYFYFSESATRDLPALRTYARRVRELLEEIEQRSQGRVRLEVVDPLPFSEAEDRATAFGLSAVPTGTAGETLFFGLAGTNALDKSLVIPFFPADKEHFLEYDIAKLLQGLSTEARPVVALLSGLTMAPGFDPATGQVGEGWVIDGELRGLFDLRRLDRDTPRIGDDVDALVVVHPRDLPEQALYAIDQYVLAGGHLLAFVDPWSDADPNASAAAPPASDLAPLFAAWGIAYDPARVVLDPRLALQVQPSAERPPVRHPAFLGIGPEYMNQDDVITSGLDTVNVAAAGSIGLAADSPLSLEPLVQTSSRAVLVDSRRLAGLADPEQLYEGLEGEGGTHTLAARASGHLRTAFPEHADREGHLAQSLRPANLVIVADTDLLADRLWVQVQRFLGQRLFNPFASNGDLVVNAVDNLVGSADLIAVRTRAGATRPFTRVEALRRQADDRFRTKERELQAELAETEQRLAQLQDGGETAALVSAGQQAELARFRAEQLRIRQELRQVRRQLDADIHALGVRLKLINILAMPGVVVLAALGFAVLRARRRREGLAIR